jgi:mycothiol synthase
MHDARIDAFLARIADHDSSPALSDAKFAELGDENRTIVIEEDGTIVAIAVVANHVQRGGADHSELESALEPGLRFDAFEDRLLASALMLVPRSQSVSVWSHRHSLDAALQRTGFTVVRELAQMVVDLPIAETRTDIVIRPFQATDAGAVVALNRMAFASHREAASLDSSGIAELMAQEGFEAQGFIILEDDQEMIGFCWTRIHENGDGEIYRIAVSPEHQGGGLGRSLVLAGFDHLARQPAVARGMLWVDMANQSAFSLYERIGMRVVATNREFERETGR